VHAANVERVARELLPPERTVVADAAPSEQRVSLSVDAAAQAFLSVEAAVERLTGIHGEAFDFLKQNLLPRSSGTSDLSAVRADRQAFDRLVRQFGQSEALIRREIGRIDGAIAAMSAADALPDFPSRKERCLSQIEKLGRQSHFAKQLRRVDGAISAAPVEGGAPVSDALVRLLAAVTDALGALGGKGEFESPEGDAGAPAPVVGPAPPRESNDSPSPQPEPSNVPASAGDPEPAMASLTRALARAEREFDTLFARAAATFDADTPEDRRLPPIRSLQVSLQARHAEALYRLGRTAEARRIWVGLARDDRLNEKLFKNLAVADSAGVDLGRPLHSWRAYAELLYFDALAAGTPRVHARERGDLHRHLGSAYAPVSLLPREHGQDEIPPDEHALLAFLNSPGRVRAFVGHTLAGMLEARLEFTSPTLVLGATRNEGDHVRTACRARMEAFIDLATGSLPDRVRDRFADLCRRHVATAAAACAKAGRLDRRRDRRYDEEEHRLIGLVKDAIQLNLRLRDAVSSDPALVRHIESIECLEEFGRLGEVPIDASPELLQSVARVFGVTDSTLLTQFIRQLQQAVIARLLQWIFDLSSDADADLRRQRYERLAADWSRRPIMAEYLPAIDDPGSAFEGCYPDEVRQALRGDGDPSRAIALLRDRAERWPASTGPARHLSLLLARQKNFAEALEMLERARARALSDAARELCDEMLRQVRIGKAQADVEQERFADALPVLLEALEADANRPDLANLVLHAFIGSARQSRRRDRHADVARALRSWVDRARARLDAPPGDDAESPTREQIDEVAAQIDQALLKYFLASTGGIDSSSTDWAAVLEAMTSLLKDYAIEEAYFIRLMARWNLGAAAVQAGRRDEGRRVLQQARADAERVKSRSANPKHVEDATSILEQLEQLA
jgi:tetratricopeptide (TPR) repeat protein